MSSNKHHCLNALQHIWLARSGRLVFALHCAPLSTSPGCLQVSAHGTGASIPPVDEMVVGMKLVTPGKGTLEVSRAEDPELFRMAKVGLGALGIVSEVTLQLVPSHKLLEHTFIMSSKVCDRNASPPICARACRDVYGFWKNPAGSDRLCP